ncbi:Major facilitator superfamily domain general substrate transporter [Penicillium angulare]|uniref:Major facilitator superfamily domain general substrate transporter n=1 Tax=Penicillium angulare TaxID=116970 RepID=UPI00253F669C|nr:Major facilitator superfamily domain general substrate transporter [Penicillium angulare]KAJ5279826.1 Major facilitator superfamily domain general substrate transporter [Penicillium angulare]
MSKQFHVKAKPFNNLMWATTTFQMGAASLPPIFVPLTESWGRRPGYLVGYSLYWIWMFPSAFAPNLATLVVTRFFGGGAAASTINIVGGMIADIWPGGVARSRPMSLYVFSQIVDISPGPFIGGSLQTIHVGNPWRWIFWVQRMWGLALMPVFWFIIRETRGHALLSKRARKIRQETGRVVYSRFELEMPSALQRLKVSTARPTRLFLTEPIVLFFTLWVSFAWGILFLFFDSVSLTFRHNYKMDTFTITLIELAISVGAVIGIFLNPIQDWLYAPSAQRDHETSGKPIPGSIIFTAGLFWYGWASVGDGKLHWIVPTLGIGCTGVGIYSILLSVLNYIADSYEKYAASALSSTSLGRNIAMDGLGHRLGFIGAGLSIVPVVLIVKGPAIRRRSPFMREPMFEEDR